jgi:hypothetical protein
LEDILSIFSDPIKNPIGPADMEFYHGEIVYRMVLLLSGYDDAKWESLGYRAQQRWLDRATEATCRLFNDSTVVDRLPLLVRNLRERA